MIQLISYSIIYIAITTICIIKIKQINDSTSFKDFVKIVMYLLLFLFTSILFISLL